jgi:hypothetical protein
MPFASYFGAPYIGLEHSVSSGESGLRFLPQNTHFMTRKCKTILGENHVRHYVVWGPTRMT